MKRLHSQYANMRVAKPTGLVPRHWYGITSQCPACSRFLRYQTTTFDRANRIIPCRDAANCKSVEKLKNTASTRNSPAQLWGRKNGVCVLARDGERWFHPTSNPGSTVLRGYLCPQAQYWAEDAEKQLPVGYNWLNTFQAMSAHNPLVGSFTTRGVSGVILVSLDAQAICRDALVLALNANTIKRMYVDRVPTLLMPDGTLQHMVLPLDVLISSLETVKEFPTEALRRNFFDFLTLLKDLSAHIQSRGNAYERDPLPQRRSAFLRMVVAIQRVRKLMADSMAKRKQKQSEAVAGWKSRTGTDPPSPRSRTVRFDDEIPGTPPTLKKARTAAHGSLPPKKRPPKSILRRKGKSTIPGASPARPQLYAKAAAAGTGAGAGAGTGAGADAGAHSTG